MISISTVTFDLNGNIVLLNAGKSDLSSATRRVTRSSTLDNGVVLADLGFTEGDRTLDIVVSNSSIEQEESIKYLQKTYPLVVLSCRDGAFLGVIADRSRQASELAFSFLVKEKLTED